MVISLNVETENTYYKIFEAIKYVFNKLNNTEKKKGRPYKYSDEQILACVVYGVRNSIFSLRELEYKINRDPLFKYIIGINKASEYSTLSLRLNKIERFTQTKERHVPRCGSKNGPEIQQPHVRRCYGGLEIASTI